jgi:beta-glucosidase
MSIFRPALTTMPTRLLLLLLSFSSLIATAQDDVVERLLAQMTLEEKVAQLSLLGIKETPTGTIVDQDGLEERPTLTVGSVIGAYGAELTRTLQAQAV